jgi:hypothetical protein
VGANVLATDRPLGEATDAEATDAEATDAEATDAALVLIDTTKPAAAQKAAMT